MDTRPLPLNPAAKEDAEYRRAWGVAGRAPFGHPLRAAYYAVLPDAPVGQHVTCEDARRYTVLIDRTLDCSTHIWSNEERRQLRRLRSKWDKRARGLDPRFNSVGAVAHVTERDRPRTKWDDLAALRAQLDPVPLGRRPRTVYVVDKAWPFGKPSTHVTPTGR